MRGNTCGEGAGRGKWGGVCGGGGTGGMCIGWGTLEVRFFLGGDWGGTLEGVIFCKLFQKRRNRLRARETEMS